MNSDDPVVIEGRFWLPNDRYRSYGRIEYDEEHGVLLHLVDTNLTQLTDSGPTGPGPVKVLFAETLGGQPLTVLGFFPTRWSYQGIGPAAGDVIDGFGERLLRGVHVRSDHDLLVSGLRSSLHGLREFLTGGDVDGGPLPIPSDPHRAETLPVSLPDGVELLLFASQHHSFSREREHMEIRASAQWTLDPPLPLPQIERDLIRPLQDLILFATRRQSCVTALTADLGPRQSVEVLQRPHPRPADAANVYALALNLRDHDDPATLIAGWFDLRRKIGPVWEQFFAVLDRPESLLEDRLLGLMSFAEGYHRALHPTTPLSSTNQKAAEKAIRAALKPLPKDARRIYKAALGFANSLTQRERLQYLTDRAFAVLSDWWDLNADLFCAELSDTRNWLIHWGQPGQNAIEEPQGMVLLVRRLIVVMYVNILLDLGVDSDGAAKVIGSGWRLEGLP
jgi:ApeA N-terminal domain 1